MATLKEFAQRFGVSPSTISRALSGHPGVRPDLRQQIRDAANDMGFQPNRQASNLRRGSSNTVGLVVPDIENPYFAEAACSIEDAAYERGYRVLLCNTGGLADRQRAYLEVLLHERVHGVILVPSDPEAVEIGRLIDAGIPVVAFDRTVSDPRSDSVLADNAENAEQATRHLIAERHRRIAFISGRPGLQPSIERLNGYLATMRAHGLDPIVFEGWQPGAPGRDAAAELLDDGSITSCVVANSVMTMGLLEVVQERGKRVPSDLAVVMFEDSRWARLLDVPLTAVGLPGRRMGEGAMRLLLDRDTESPRPARTRIYAGDLRIRASSRVG